jgi:predicted nuclease with TOPRIM domain
MKEEEKKDTDLNYKVPVSSSITLGEKRFIIEKGWKLNFVIRRGLKELAWESANHMTREDKMVNLAETLTQVCEEKHKLEEENKKLRSHNYTLRTEIDESKKQQPPT